VIIKASGGGGGRGMRVVHTEAHLGNAVSMTKSEAKAAFGNDQVYMEKFSRTRATSKSRCSPTARAMRSISASATARCSAATRKVVEEAPAPGISAAQREQIGKVCVEACVRIGYRGAGTFEFLFENGKFYFIEMNTRIQVEHPGHRDDHRRRSGARATADRRRRETVAAPAGRQSSPATRSSAASTPRTRIRSCRHPERSSVSSGRRPRRAHGLRTSYDGYRIPPNYDSMIGKLIVHGRDRDTAIARMRIALGELVIDGVKTNIPLQQRILADGGFQHGGQNIHYLEKRIAEQREKAIALG
jgi:acetyl-CoA carboxylase biotin carboxylase subunit